MKSLTQFINKSEVQSNVTSEDAKRLQLPDDERWSVVLYGGSIGEQDTKKFRVGSKRCSISRENLTRDEAKDIAKRYNKFLSPGEKKYYRMLYSAVQAINIKESNI